MVIYQVSVAPYPRSGSSCFQKTSWIRQRLFQEAVSAPREQCKPGSSPDANNVESILVATDNLESQDDDKQHDSPPAFPRARPDRCKRYRSRQHDGLLP